MKTFAIILALAAGSVSAQTYVDGHLKKDGTYVPGHYRSDSNDTKRDNWSTKDNTNPYTGERGTKSPEPVYRAPVCGYTQAGRYVCR